MKLYKLHILISLVLLFIGTKSNAAVRELSQDELAKAVGKDYTQCECYNPYRTCSYELPELEDEYCERIPGECKNPGAICEVKFTSGPHQHEICTSEGARPHEQCEEINVNCVEYTVHQCHWHCGEADCVCSDFGYPGSNGTATVAGPWSYYCYY